MTDLNSIMHLPTRMSSPTMASQRLHALIIGIDKYAAPDVHDLEGAVADAEAVFQYLVGNLKVPKSNIRLLTGSDATRTGIIDNLKALRTDERIDHGDPILIYYAGHGGEARCPMGWESGGANIQMILPHDFHTELDGRDVPGIPDRTIGAFLTSLAKEKGDNITVIFDCCFAGSGTRGINAEPCFIIRSTSISNDMPINVDVDICRAFAGSRGSAIPHGFHQSGLRSHVFLAACGAKEQSFELQGRGLFTKASLDILGNVHADKLTYAELIGRLNMPPQQRPQCEGINQHRILFTTKVRDDDVLQVGPEIEHYILRVSVAQSVIQKLLQDLQCESADGQSDHDLHIALDGDRVTFQFSDPLLKKYGFAGTPYHIRWNFDDIRQVVRTASRYYRYLRHSSKRHVLRKKVHIEFTRVKPLEDEYDEDFNQLYQADGENLNRDGVIDVVVEEDAMYGMKIVNDWNIPIYLSVFYFDQSDLSIKSWYNAPCAKIANQDPSLLPKGSLTIGYGSGGVPPHTFFLHEGQDIDINFLKIFLSTNSTDLPNASQPSPFHKDRGESTIANPHATKFQDSKLVTLVLRKRVACLVSINREY